MKALFSFESLEKVEAKNFVEVNELPEICCSNLKEIVSAVANHKVIAFNSLGKFSLYNLVENILYKYQSETKISLTSYGLSEPAIRKLANLKFKGQLAELHCLLDYRIKQRQPKAFKLLSSIANSIGYQESHAKITVIDNAEISLVIIGSQNWTRNTKHEAGVIICSAPTAYFYQKYIASEIINKRGT